MDHAWPFLGKENQWIVFQTCVKMARFSSLWNRFYNKSNLLCNTNKKVLAFIRNYDKIIIGNVTDNVTENGNSTYMDNEWLYQLFPKGGYR